MGHLIREATVCFLLDLELDLGAVHKNAESEEMADKENLLAKLNISCTRVEGGLKAVKEEFLTEGNAYLIESGDKTLSILHRPKANKFILFAPYSDQPNTGSFKQLTDLIDYISQQYSSKNLTVSETVLFMKLPADSQAVASLLWLERVMQQGVQPNSLQAVTRGAHQMMRDLELGTLSLKVSKDQKITLDLLLGLPGRISKGDSIDLLKCDDLGNSNKAFFVQIGDHALGLYLNEGGYHLYNPYTLFPSVNCYSDLDKLKEELSLYRSGEETIQLIPLHHSA